MLVQNGVRARCQKHAITIWACQSAILALRITLYFDLRSWALQNVLKGRTACGQLVGKKCVLRPRNFFGDPSTT